MRLIPAVAACAMLAGACAPVVNAMYPLTPLASAARSGDLEQIDRLIAAGADVNAGSGVNDTLALVMAQGSRVPNAPDAAAVRVLMQNNRCDELLTLMR